jgi:hypothetical protein
MRTRQEIPAAELRAALAEAGWEVASVDEGAEWRRRELWRLQSIWSPRDRQAFLTFLTDPMDDSPNPKIWAVLASATGPTRDAADGYSASFGKEWPTHLSQLVEHLSALRDAISS